MITNTINMITRSIRKLRVRKLRTRESKSDVKFPLDLEIYI